MIVHANNGTFQIDDSDFARVSNKRWRLNDFNYPCSDVLLPAGWRTIPVHRFLFGDAPKGFVWDHINRDQTDNRRQNLRITTQVVNQRNRNLSSANTSGVTGVTFNTARKLWCAQISVNYRTIPLGRFASKENAVKARKDAEDLYWGDNR